jgi:adenylate kinase family enzyme
MRRVLVIGSGGSGKSTFARQLAERTGLPLVHLDELYWRPGWQAPPDAEWDQTVATLIEGEAWLMDGNYGRTLAMRLAACDTAIFLDRSRWLCVWRIIARWLRYRGVQRPEMASGCPERLTWEFVWWVWAYPTRQRPGILRALAGIADRKRVVILRTGREVTGFLSSHSAPSA